ncbi:prepilin-type N-terminal cleavage/methylation domain-containing protein [Yonghaparkia sp. Root332]|uniref:prepilin-type N-terminal cleavage/methylation domain-containing protein n=1 Tax=Yonghaparkia sp. Root332 TaxID=1736516 RepID=UPI0006F47E65|nr:prepilin-type N-terminal cleavage/methylation domain-containing protein [Yonghaparkia sp. Root332]KQV26100.1 hypothetical protein ASC54_03980 [Yonghaparkia sp. Root332]
MNTNCSEQRSERDDDAGFGLVEIVISMFLLALLAVAFLPLLVDSLRTTVRNATTATATQLVSEQLDAVSLLSRTCAALAAFEGATVPTVTDERGTIYTATRNAATCPSSGYPLSVAVTVSVSADSQPGLIVESTTTVIIESAN